MGRILRGALVGLLFALLVGVWPAHANVSGVSVTKPTSSQVLAGSYGSGGSPSGFVQPLQGKATTSCSSGFDSVTLKVTGPSSYSKTFNVSPPGSNGTFTFNANWDTSDLRNGVYDVRLDVVEPGDTLFNSCGQSGSAHLTSKLANPPQAPVWDGSPTAASDGSAKVTLSWKKNPELDVVEYHVFRQGPDGQKVFIVSATSPGSSGCSLSGGTYTCVDPASNFPEAYDGTYNYAIMVWRDRPSYNSSETVKNCNTTGDPCVASDGSDVRAVTLVAPTPTPTPTDSPTPGGSPTPTPGGSGSPTPGGTTTPGFGGSTPGARGGTSVLSFGGSGGQSFNDFYSGTYSENLPYQPKTLIVGGAGTRTPDGKQIEAASVSDAPPNYRTIMLPVAGGLLAFLSAAHVRRLLLHF